METATHSPLPETVEWRGPGWYASCQEGSYESTHIHTYQVGDENETDAPDTYERGLGMPFFVQNKDDMLERNPDARICDWVNKQ